MTMTLPALLPTGAILLRRGLPILILFVASVTLLGCQPFIEVVQPASPSVSPLLAPTVEPDERGLAIIGVDFDPPLEAGQLVTSGGVTLLVAIENRGRQVEPTARVSARLHDPDAGRTSDLANETITVRGLAPGELRVVRFTQVTNLPVRFRYMLTAEVAPVPGEHELGDNVKTYDIIVHAAE